MTAGLPSTDNVRLKNVIYGQVSIILNVTSEARFSNDQNHQTRSTHVAANVEFSPRKVPAIVSDPGRVKLYDISTFKRNNC